MPGTVRSGETASAIGSRWDRQRTRPASWVCRGRSAMQAGMPLAGTEVRGMPGFEAAVPLVNQPTTPT